MSVIMDDDFDKMGRKIRAEWDEAEALCGDRWRLDYDHGYNRDVSFNHFHFIVDVKKSLTSIHMNWCGRNCQGDFYRKRANDNEEHPLSPLSKMAFEKEADAFAFKLRWV